jgi:hypothetical protein
MLHQMVLHAALPPLHSCQRRQMVRAAQRYSLHSTLSSKLSTEASNSEPSQSLTSDGTDALHCRPCALSQCVG